MKPQAVALTGFVCFASLILLASLAPAHHRPASFAAATSSRANCRAQGYHWGDETLATARASGETVLVTGVAGFIGSNVAKACLRAGMHVVGVDDLSGGFIENVPEGVELYVLDVKNATALAALWVRYGRFDYVYHIAAYAAEGLSHFIRSYNYRNNLVGSVELINNAVKHNTSVFVFTSSIAVYGTNPVLPLTERSLPNPEDPYGIAKYATEMDLKAAHATHNMSYVIVRPHNVYGPNQNIADKYRNVVGIFINNLLAKRPMTVFGDGTQTRCFSYIDDVAPIIAKAPLLPHVHNQVFNIGTDQATTLNKLADMVRDAMGIHVGAAGADVVHLDRRHEVDHAQAWHEKLRCYFQPAPPTSLEEGLRLTAEWVKSKRHGFDPVEFAAVELLRGMPKSWRGKAMRETHAISRSSADNPRLSERDKRQAKTIDGPLLPV
eukprot:Rhum_TRINITY_DN18767_c0_g1::Rhum_TRINITY_DN18767_c0_g1_i1::g.168289::m.168289/K01784/galE, GALE; UDP-glucose 4-epimerase